MEVGITWEANEKKKKVINETYMGPVTDERSEVCAPFRSIPCTCRPGMLSRCGCEPIFKAALPGSAPAARWEAWNE